MDPPPEKQDSQPQPKPKRILRFPKFVRPEREPEDKPSAIYTFLSSPFSFILIAFGLSPILLIAEMSDWSFRIYLKLAFVALFFLMGSTLLLRALFVVAASFSKLQKRLSELMATTFFGAAALALVISLINPGADVIPWFALLSFGWAFAGSIWAWDRMTILQEQNGRERFLLLIKGWLGIPGTLAGVVFIFNVVAVILNLLSDAKANARFIPQLLTSIGISVPVMLLAWPMALIEYRLWRRSRPKKHSD